MRKTRWNIKEVPKDKDIKLKDFFIDKDILKILYSRGIKTEQEIREFLNPKLENIRNPYDLKDMDKTVQIIEKAIKENKNIWIYGDYDVDGITSTSILYMALKELGAENVEYYIPIRDEGYGLNKEALKKIKDSGAELVITVDCGITAFEEVDYANEIKLPIIITDHHNLLGTKVPNALTVVNPKRKENIFPFENLAGVGTIFMVLLALFNKFEKIEKVYDYLDLVAIGTVADIVPLIEENRIFTKFGLDKLPYTKNRGLNYLLYKLYNNEMENNVKTEYTTYDVGFVIAPVFNAAGRLKDAKMVVKLLTSDNMREIEIIVKELINKNFERKELQNNIIEKVEENIIKNNINDDFVIIDYSKDYHHGVIGIVASKMVETYYKPTIIMELKEDEGIAIGSCRSIEGFNILEALQSMPELFVKFGGHSGAAGFTINIKNIKLFKEKINNFAKNKLKEEDFVKIINIDKQLSIEKISYEFFQIMDLLKPFGFGNPSPTFYTKNVLLENIKYIGDKKNHIMFDFKQKGFHNRNAVWFGAGEYFKEINKNLICDIVYKLKVEYFQDKYYTKVYIDDIKKSELKDDRLSYYNSLHSTTFPMKSIFYTNLEIDIEKEITMKKEFDQIALFQGRKFIGKLDYNISHLLIQLNEFYNWNFEIKIDKINKNTTHNIINILIKRKYDFECFDNNNIVIFNKIKHQLIKNMEYDSLTKKILATHFKENKNIVLLNDIKCNENEMKIKLDNLLLTLGMFYNKKTNEKIQIFTKNKRKFICSSYIKNYFTIIEKTLELNENHEFFVFYLEKIEEKYNEIIENLIAKNKKIIIILNKEIEEKYKNSFVEKNIEIIENKILLENNIKLLSKIEKEEIKNTKNIYTQYLPIVEKMKIKEKYENNEEIYGDDSIFEIL